MARASSSLPLPLSPRISTLASERAISRLSVSSSSMRAERLTMAARQASPATDGPAAGAVSASASAILSSSALPSKGFVR